MSNIRLIRIWTVTASILWLTANVVFCSDASGQNGGVPVKRMELNPAERDPYGLGRVTHLTTWEAPEDKAAPQNGRITGRIVYTGLILPVNKGRRQFILQLSYLWEDPEFKRREAERRQSEQIGKFRAKAKKQKGRVDAFVWWAIATITLDGQSVKVKRVAIDHDVLLPSPVFPFSVLPNRLIVFRTGNLARTANINVGKGEYPHRLIPIPYDPNNDDLPDTQENNSQ